MTLRKKASVGLLMLVLPVVIYCYVIGQDMADLYGDGSDLQNSNTGVNEGAGLNTFDDSLRPTVGAPNELDSEITMSITGTASGAVIPKTLKQSPEEKLYRALFGRGYLKNVRPAADPNDAVVVNVGMCVMMIEDLIERDQMMIMAACVKMLWKDFRLTWNPSAYNNISVWVP